MTTPLITSATRVSKLVSIDSLISSPLSVTLARLRFSISLFAISKAPPLPIVPASVSRSLCAIFAVPLSKDNVLFVIVVFTITLSFASICVVPVPLTAVVNSPSYKFK